MCPDKSKEPPISPITISDTPTGFQNTPQLPNTNYLNIPDNIYSNDLDELMDPNPFTNTNNSNIPADYARPSIHTSNVYLDTSDVLPTAYHMQASLSDSQIKEHHPQFLPWDSEKDESHIITSLTSIQSHLKHKMYLHHYLSNHAPKQC